MSWEGMPAVLGGWGCEEVEELASYGGGGSAYDGMMDLKMLNPRLSAALL